jgi:replicative DNA helicase Mcm
VVRVEESSIEIDYGERFKDFLRNFRDRNGELKYMQRLRRMINFNQSSLIIDYPDLYR